MPDKTFKPDDAAKFKAMEKLKAEMAKSRTRVDKQIVAGATPQEMEELTGSSKKRGQ
jgi:hypothetical protein